MQQVPFCPFTIHLADGRSYRIEHPDFVLASSADTPQVVIEQLNGSTHRLSVLLMTSIEEDPLPARG